MVMSLTPKSLDHGRAPCIASVGLNSSCVNCLVLEAIAFWKVLLSVPLGASGDEKSPSITVAGDPVGTMPADTRLFEVLFEGATPCLLWPPPLSTAVFGHPVHCCMCGSFLRQSEDVASHFQSPFLTMSWSRSVHVLLVTSSFVTRGHNEYITYIHNNNIYHQCTSVRYNNFRCLNGYTLHL